MRMSDTAEAKRQRQNHEVGQRRINAARRARAYNKKNPMLEPATADELLDTYDYFDGWCYFCGTRTLWTDGRVVCADGDRDNRDLGNLLWVCNHCGMQKIHIDTGPDGPITPTNLMDAKRYTYGDISVHWFCWWVYHNADEDYMYGRLEYKPGECDAWLAKKRDEVLNRESLGLDGSKSIKRKVYIPHRGNAELESKIDRVFGHHKERFDRAQDRARRANTHHPGQDIDAFDYYRIYLDGGGSCTFCGARTTWEKGRVSNFRALRGVPAETYALGNLVWVCSACSHKKAGFEPYKVMKGKYERGTVSAETFVRFCDKHTDIIPQSQYAYVEQQRLTI